eukprot:Platyproteum_vivax@DN2378_c0_g1_i2.p2
MPLCRDVEFDNIRKHLESSVRAGGTGNVLYISGMPGTGKTLTVRSAVKFLQKQKGMPKFVYMEVNSMTLSAPTALYQAMYKGLHPKQAKTPSAQKCFSHLDAMFNSKASARMR